MTHLRLWLGVAVLAAGVQPLRADPPAPADREALALAAEIDRQLAQRQAAAKVEPAPLADDAEFLRRVYLDVTGRIPTVHDARAFFQDKSPDKRQRLIEKLLESPGYVQNFTHTWRALLLPDSEAVNQNPGLRI